MKEQVYLLAAGKGRRAGGPKALQPHSGVTVLEKHIDFLTNLFRPESIAVTIQEAWLKRCMDIHPKVRWVTADSSAPAMGSMQALLRAAPLDRWTFFYHVDMPVWEGEVYGMLSEQAIAHPEAEALIPVFEGRGGHPVLLSPSSKEGLMSLDPYEGRLDRWMKERKVLRVEVPFPCILENWNEVIPS